MIVDILDPQLCHLSIIMCLVAMFFLDQSVDMFGQRVGFVKFKAEVFDDLTGAKVFSLHGRLV